MYMLWHNFHSWSNYNPTVALYVENLEHRMIDGQGMLCLKHLLFKVAFLCGDVISDQKC